ncbi:MAG: TonB-dependent receptor plug domain-containing protein [Pseudohongiella sp.]|nr:TonB-dependent receptor plug domain-containing protein [Pseudohongiella sp.]
MPSFLIRFRAVTAIILVAAGMLLNPVTALSQPLTDDNSTVTYPAEFFAQYEPFSVNDMLDRIPGINVARQGGGNSNGGPGSSSGSNRRGLGLGGDQILINGRRVTGKENEGNSQLSRIPANQVQYIEIIRGTSEDLDVRGGNQVINIVLLEAESRSSIAYELNTDHYHDGEFKPGGKISLTGQRGKLDYLLSVESEPRWEYRVGSEFSLLPDGTANDTVRRLNTRDSQPLNLSTNLGYQFGDKDIVHFNVQYKDSDAPSIEERSIIDQLSSPVSYGFEFDDTANSNEFWEIGGDYEHTFANGARWKTLFISNKKEDASLRERFEVNGNDSTKDLFLGNFNRYQERIGRTSYSFSFGQNQGLELGIERAQTILDSSLQLGLLRSGGATSAAFGGLTPITNSNASVEEIRYESFLVHNWQLNERMSLESTLIVETSEIAQSGDVSKRRDFDFIRPKVDYRFDITPAVQFRATVEKDVAQLSFNDFTANISGSDDDQDAIAGNPDLRQSQSWRYTMNLEYRFNNDNGVISSSMFFHDLEDVIDKIDVSTGSSILSANGNIGDGERYGMSVDASLRLGFIGLPEILVTSRFDAEDSSVTDPFLGIDRRLSHQGRGNYSLGFRHDVPARKLNYGFTYRGSIKDNNKVFDIDKIEAYNTDAFVIMFLEVQGWAGLTYRFEATNPHESERCRIRSRYVGGTIATGTLNEIENSCSHTGEKYAIKIRGTF